MFLISAHVVIKHLAIIKKALLSELPGSKSSHRCEAMARALGFRSYASLRASDRNKMLEVNTVIFKYYLASKGTVTTAMPLLRAIAKILVLDLLNEFPMVSLHGWSSEAKHRLQSGRYEKQEQACLQFLTEQEEMTLQFYVDSFILAVRFLKTVPKTATVRPRANSYWIKHIAENYSFQHDMSEKIGPQYIPNGVLILAAIHCGFEFKIPAFGSPNAILNASVKYLYDLDFTLRPDTGWAQDRRRAQERKADKAQRQPKSIWKNSPSPLKRRYSK